MVLLHCQEAVELGVGILYERKVFNVSPIGEIYNDIVMQTWVDHFKETVRDVPFTAEEIEAAN